MPTHSIDILTIVATTIVTVGIPAIVGQLWRLSVQTARIGTRVDDIDRRVAALEQARRVAMVLAVMVALVGFRGCAHARAIERSAGEVRMEATSARAEIDAAIATGDVGPRAAPHIHSAGGRMDRIVTLADGIGVHVQGVQDRQSWIARVLSWWWVIPVGIIALASLYTFLPMILARLVAVIPAALCMVPRAIRDSAKLARETFSDPTKFAEYVAAQRAASPLFDASFRRSATIAGSKGGD